MRAHGPWGSALGGGEGVRAGQPHRQQLVAQKAQVPFPQGPGAQ